MTIITLPPDLEDAILDEARRCSTTPENLVLEDLRKRHAVPSQADTASTPTLYDHLQEFIGKVEGKCQSNSCDSLTDYLEERQCRGKL